MLWIGGLRPALLSIGFSPGDAWICTSAPSLVLALALASRRWLLSTFILFCVWSIADVFEGHDSVFYRKAPGESQSDYAMDHSSYIY